jgi:putative ABC transport system ATP-binding protein
MSVLDPIHLDATDALGAGHVVRATGLVRRYGHGATAVDALRGVDIAIAGGEMVAVMGPSGSGKSTLMHLLAGLDRPTKGSVEIAGREITTLREAALTRLRRDRIGFVFQGFNLLPTLSAEENVALPLRLAGRTGAAGRARVDELLDRVGLAGRKAHRPAELSGGQQQRVAVARALVTEPAVVFADEPTGNLDSRSSAEVLGLLRDAASELGRAVVMVTHDALAAARADRVLFLADGLVVAEHPHLGSAEILDVIKEIAR